MSELRALRLAAGLTQDELSIGIGRPRDIIYNAELGRTELYPTEWAAVRYVCNARIEKFNLDKESQ